MMSEVFYKYFIVLKRMRPDIKFIIGGDFAQLLPVKERIENCDYKESIALYELCDGQRIQLSKCRRSDDRLFNMLLPNNINNVKITDFTHFYADRHISFTNKKRIQINKYMMDKVVKANKGRKQILKFNKLAYDDNSQDVELLSGMPIIARKNCKELNICNNETFTIKEIKHTKNIIIIEDVDKKQEIKFEDFQKLFYVAYCITVHKSQGQSFNHPYTIHEFERFDDRMKYVALSRATDIKFINTC
jgi:ATP-dependent exoDNAse (exonuclease V) alpha subunit